MSEEKKSNWNMHIILLSNRYPCRGESFLETEIEFLPSKVKMDVCPFFNNPRKLDERKTPSQIKVNQYTKPSLGERVKCFYKAMKVFAREKEYKATLNKKHHFRNITKAIKFAYISELRITSISKLVGSINEKSGNDLIIYAYWMYETAYVGARLKALYPNCRLVTRCHGYDLYEERHANGYLPFRNFILKQTDLICPISRNGYEYIYRQYGSSIAKKASISRLGTIRKAEIPDIQIKEDSIVLASCSNLADVKRVNLILNALKQCSKQVMWYHFGDGELKAKLEKQAEDLPPNIRYKFMGYQPNEEVQRFYAGHYIDAFLNVSKSEGVPVSIMEAESYGIPIIATNVGGTSEIVHNEKNGILLRPDFSDEEFLNAVDNVIENADNFRIEAIKTWQTMSDAHEVFPEFYKRLDTL